MAPRLAAFSDQITQNEALFRRIEAVYKSPRQGEADARAAAPGLAATTPTSCAPAPSSTRAAKTRLSRDQPAAGRAVHAGSARTCWPTRTSYDRRPARREADLAGLPESRARRAPRRPPPSRGHAGRVGHHQHPLVRRAVPDLLRPAATCARRSGACSSTAATTAARTTTTPSSPRSCKLRAERAKLLGYPTHAHWRLENAMAEDARSAPWS